MASFNEKELLLAAAFYNTNLSGFASMIVLANAYAKMRNNALKEYNNAMDRGCNTKAQIDECSELNAKHNMYKGITNYWFDKTKESNGGQVEINIDSTYLKVYGIPNYMLLEAKNECAVWQQFLNSLIERNLTEEQFINQYIND